MTVSFTQQSCSLKGNTLGLAGTRKVWNSLTGLHDNLDKMLELDHEIDIGEIKRVHRVLLKDTSKENVEFIDGRIQRAAYSYETKPDSELIIKSVLEHFTYLQLRNSFRGYDNYRYTKQIPFIACSRNHRNYGMTGFKRYADTKRYADKPLKIIYGNLPYVAPEVIVGREYTFASDIYSIVIPYVGN
ncbi:hypothetical protein RhiirA4_482815 [Rhizophagus irregularis]|uniref:Protein kinase domain-containing protein n=1 Tax=Rhizophagus irregularis TaxID=588596 RepID=A0A2I1HLQ1_9GLOM|nr:hypothetical protein RhiirA4_482815 [Rhizophagus irregularis]